MSRNGKSPSHDVEWDFSSDSDIASNNPNEQRPKRRSKPLSRNNSITFADSDQVNNRVRPHESFYQKIYSSSELESILVWATYFLLYICQCRSQ